MPPEDRTTEPSPDARDETAERSRSWTWTLVHRSRTPANASFWTTGAGIVTALATLLTAAAGLIVALGQVGVIGGGSQASVAPPPPAPVQPAAAGGSDADERRLLEHVPVGIRADCGTTAYHGEQALAAVDCSQADVSDLHYELFASKADLEEHWAVRRNAAGGADGDCARGEAGESEYTRDGDGVVGDLVCYEGEGKSWLEWTHEPTLVYAYAARSGGDLAALHAWWADVPGPVGG
jgi:hypothetical protein